MDNSSDDRKTRLQALAARAGRSRQEENNGQQQQQQQQRQGVEDDKKVVKFRNYAPNDKSLEQIRKEVDDNGDDDGDGPATKKVRTDKSKTGGAVAATTSSTSSKSLLQDALRETQQDIKSTPTPTTASTISQIKPKKINDDLKRDIQEKLNKLERRTQKAIVEMLKERLELEATEAMNDDDDNQDVEGCDNKSDLD
jgi:coiled-coil domain-containing protein 12